MGNNAAVCYSITLYRILEGRALERLTRRKDVLKKCRNPRFSLVNPISLGRFKAREKRPGDEVEWSREVTWGSIMAHAVRRTEPFLIIPSVLCCEIPFVLTS